MIVIVVQVWMIINMIEHHNDNFNEAVSENTEAVFLCHF